MRCLHGEMLGRLVVNSPELEERIAKMGIRDSKRIYGARDLAPGKKIIFAACGVTQGALLNGVRFFGEGCRTLHLVEQPIRDGHCVAAASQHERRDALDLRVPYAERQSHRQRRQCVRAVDVPERQMVAQARPRRLLYQLELDALRRPTTGLNDRALERVDAREVRAVRGGQATGGHDQEASTQLFAGLGLDEPSVAGLVVRRRDTSDRRAVSVELTDAGRTKHAEMLRAVQAFNQRLLAGFSSDELDELQALLGKLEQNARADSELRA